jgi:hypothetical protein
MTTAGETQAQSRLFGGVRITATPATSSETN